MNFFMLLPKENGGVVVSNAVQVTGVQGEGFAGLITGPALANTVSSEIVGLSDQLSGRKPPLTAEDVSPHILNGRANGLAFNSITPDAQLGVQVVGAVVKDPNGLGRA